jgi:hypothetical protein
MALALGMGCQSNNHFAATAAQRRYATIVFT